MLLCVPIELLVGSLPLLWRCVYFEHVLMNLLSSNSYPYHFLSCTAVILFIGNKPNTPLASLVVPDRQQF
jgi:hypothetical protein